jgi:hypothetical protein
MPWMDCISTESFNTKYKGFKMAKYKAPNYLTQGGTTQDQGQGLLYNTTNYPSQTFEIMSNGEMPSNMAIGNYSGVNNTGMPSFESNLDIKDIGGLDADVGGGLLGDIFGENGMSNLSSIVGLGTSLYSMYLGNKQMGLYEDVMNRQLDMAEEKWGLTKEELARTKRVRQNLSGGYSNNGNYAAQNAKNPVDPKPSYGSTTAYPVA